MMMYHDCPEEKCKAKCYMFPLNVTAYLDQTTVGMVLLCPSCYTRTLMEYGLESTSGVIIDSRPMSDAEVTFVHELDAI